jgi:hypothetical protein
MKHIDLYTGVYEITLLTAEEYERYEPKIPTINDRWWLRSPGSGQLYAKYVSDAGGVPNYGDRVNTDDGAVRPALKSEIIDLPIGERFIALGNRWTVIDTGLAISNESVAHRRFDCESNDWETSELRAWLEDWAKDGERLEE